VVEPLTPDGTPERDWQSWLSANPLPELDLSALTGAGRVLVLAAHPDDEVLAVAGLCRALHAAAVPLAFVWASDGEAAFGPGTEDSGLARTRRKEAVKGLQRLGIEEPTAFFLALPDGRLGEYAHLLKGFLSDIVRDDDVLLVPWSGDGHPDHEVCGEVALTVRGAGVVQYPLWLWRWATPGEQTVPWQRAGSLRLSEADRDAKRTAIGEHATQVRPPAKGRGAKPRGSDTKDSDTTDSDTTDSDTTDSDTTDSDTKDNDTKDREPTDGGAVLPPSVLAYFDRDFEVVFG